MSFLSIQLDAFVRTVADVGVVVDPVDFVIHISFPLVLSFGGYYPNNWQFRQLVPVSCYQ